MRIKRRTEITVETEQVWIIRQSRQAAPAWCSQCAATTWMVAPKQAALLSEQSLLAIRRQMKDGPLHFIETEEGQLLICLNSLMDQDRERERALLAPAFRRGRRARSRSRS